MALPRYPHALAYGKFIETWHGASMDINLAIYGGAVCTGALAAVTAQWVYNEWLRRLDRSTVVMPSIKDPLAQMAALNDLLAIIRDEDARESGPVRQPPTPYPDLDEWGVMPDYEGDEVVS
jgi:hypothetical protein